jgi:hypothetical protein
MNPDLDRQPRQPPGRWPYPADDAATRARKVAMMYRAALGVNNWQLRDECDATAVGYGETWMLDRPDIVDPESEVTTAQAAELVNQTPRTIRDWACLEHPEQPGTPLLPRFKMRGRERTYLAGKVLEAAATVARTRHAKRRTT